MSDLLIDKHKRPPQPLKVPPREESPSWHLSLEYCFNITLWEPRSRFVVKHMQLGAPMCRTQNFLCLPCGSVAMVGHIICIEQINSNAGGIVTHCTWLCVYIPYQHAACTAVTMVYGVCMQAPLSIGVDYSQLKISQHRSHKTVKSAMRTKTSGQPVNGASQRLCNSGRLLVYLTLLMYELLLGSTKIFCP